jgi:hypothetical protein
MTSLRVVQYKHYMSKLHINYYQPQMNKSLNVFRSPSCGNNLYIEMTIETTIHNTILSQQLIDANYDCRLTMNVLTFNLLSCRQYSNPLWCFLVDLLLFNLDHMVLLTLRV